MLFRLVPMRQTAVRGAPPRVWMRSPPHSSMKCITLSSEQETGPHMLPKRNASTAMSEQCRFLFGLLGFLMILDCGYGSSPPEIVKGRQFPVEYAKSIAKGMTATQVRQILGDPLEIQPVGANERWHYFAREQKEDVLYILGV